jgi:hypothetical protein
VDIALAKGMTQSPPTDFWCNSPLDVVIKGALFLEKYHILPEAGGWLDQDPLLLDDILRYIAFSSTIEEIKADGDDVDDDAIPSETLW